MLKLGVLNRTLKLPPLVPKRSVMDPTLAEAGAGAGLKAGLGAGARATGLEAANLEPELLLLPPTAEATTELI